MPLSPYPWSDDYLLGLEGVDDEHRKLFEIVERIYAVSESPDAKEAIRTVLYDLSDYMRHHFGNEEAYMAAIGYPELQEHKTHHAEIIEGMNQLLSKPVRLDILHTKMKIAAKKMLVDHILIEDVKIKRWVETHRAPAGFTESAGMINIEEV